MNSQYVKIKILMLKKGLKIKDLASIAGVTPSFISQLIQGHKKSKRVQRIIALQLGRDVKSLFS